MRTKQPKRVAAALALATGLTLLGGMTAQADTISASSNTASSVEASSTTPGDVTPSYTIEGPFDTKRECEAHRAKNPKPSGGCFDQTIHWFYTTST